MTLDSGYLDYPKRGYGMDHDLYPFSNLFERPPVDWGEGRRLAVLIAPVVEYFPLVAAETPIPVPGHMVTPYPDLRHYTAREYGTRVGLFRFLRLFERLGIKASVPINARLWITASAMSAIPVACSPGPAGAVAPPDLFCLRCRRLRVRRQGAG